MYTIGQISKQFHLPVSTLRYYDKEGLFPGMERRSGIRVFGDPRLQRSKPVCFQCLTFNTWQTDGTLNTTIIWLRRKLFSI